MSSRSLLAGLALLAAVAAAPPRAAAWDLTGWWRCADVVITVQETPGGLILVPVVVGTGEPSCPCRACPDQECCYELPDCLLMGLHPALTLLRPQLVVDTARPNANAGRNRFSIRLSPVAFTLDVELQLGEQSYERLPVPPQEVLRTPVIPVEPELIPFLPPEFEARVPRRRLFVRACAEELPTAEIERLPVPPVLVPAAAAEANSNLRKTMKAQRWLRKGEKHFLAGRHDEARTCYERVQRLCPGSECDRQAAERLEQLLVKEVMERVLGLGVNPAEPEKVPAPREMLEIEPIEPSPIDDEVARLLEACRQAHEDGRCCEARDLARRVLVLAPVRAAQHPLVRELQVVPQVEIRTPELPPVDYRIIRTLEQMLSPRLIIEAEKTGTEEQEPPRPVEGDAGSCGVREALSRILGPGVCLDIDCGGARTRAQGQLLLGGLAVRLHCTNGKVDVTFDLVDTVPLTHAGRGWLLRWLDQAAESLGSEEQATPIRD